MREERRFRKYKENSSRIWKKTKYKSKETRKTRYSREERLQKERTTREIHSKDVVWVRWCKIQKVFKEVGKKLAKMEVSLFRGEILKEGWYQSCKQWT